MKVMSLMDVGMKAAVQKAVGVLRVGGVVLYPTDTLYGLGADALSDTAVDKVYAIKGRDKKKPIHAIVSDLTMAEMYGEIDEFVRLIVNEVPKGKVTFVVRKKEGLDSGICRGIETFGFRTPSNDVCQAFLTAFGAPITATSANKADEQTFDTVEDIVEQLCGGAGNIDLAIDAGELPAAQPSTVIDFTGKRPIILREGAVPAADIWDILKQEY